MPLGVGSRWRPHLVPELINSGQPGTAQLRAGLLGIDTLASGLALQESSYRSSAYFPSAGACAPCALDLPSISNDQHTCCRLGNHCLFPLRGQYRLVIDSQGSHPLPCILYVLQLPDNMTEREKRNPVRCNAQTIAKVVTCRLWCHLLPLWGPYRLMPKFAYLLY